MRCLIDWRTGPDIDGLFLYFKGVMKLESISQFLMCMSFMHLNNPLPLRLVNCSLMEITQRST